MHLRIHKLRRFTHPTWKNVSNHGSKLERCDLQFRMSILVRVNTHLFVSHVMTLPSKPDVTRRRVLVSYSMFFTQLAWPCNEQTFEFSFLRSHNAIVVSSEQVANKRLSKNLQGGTYVCVCQTQRTWMWMENTEQLCWGIHKHTLCCWHSPREPPSGFWCVWMRWDRTAGLQSARRPRSARTCTHKHLSCSREIFHLFSSL